MTPWRFHITPFTSIYFDQLGKLGKILRKEKPYVFLYGGWEGVKNAQNHSHVNNELLPYVYLPQ